MSDIYDELKYFTRSEFREWADQMSHPLLRCLDKFRSLWGARVDISPHSLALGRHLGNSMSGHNVDRWKSVEAADGFPLFMDNKAELNRALSCAIAAGATGIGLYTDTKPSYMIHIDTRPDRTSDDPRLWSRVDKVYGPIARVL